MWPLIRGGETITFCFAALPMTSPSGSLLQPKSTEILTQNIRKGLFATSKFLVTVVGCSEVQAQILHNKEE